MKKNYIAMNTKLEFIPGGTFRGGEQEETESLPKGTFRCE